MTCETLAFMFPIPPPEEETDIGELEHSCLQRIRVYFDGPVHGSLALTLPRSMLPALAANMLALDAESTTSDQRADAARELCNVVCGNLLPAVAGPDPVFAVSPPELCDQPPAADSAASASARVWLDEGWVEAELRVDGGLDRLTAIKSDDGGPAGMRSVA
jgi:hypothetical protein